MRKAGRWARIALAAGFVFVAYVYLTLPDVRPLATSNPTTTAFIERRAREAERDGRRFVKRQRWVPYSRISPQLKRAVLVAEDSAFWQHEGIDFDQIRESLEVNVERLEFARGASTITQQLAKNLYLSPSKNPVRKLREFMIARRLEAALSKQRILELYLNVIEWGDGIFGAEAASRAYFGLPAAALGPDEAALLAGAIINPRVLDPGHPSPRLLRRQRMILRRMGHVLPPVDTAPSTPVVPERPEPAPVP
jgi:monofunctional biosynthetic peptidoglycan transglycosylase